jgi:hypothetical protein
LDKKNWLGFERRKVNVVPVLNLESHYKNVRKRVGIVQLVLGFGIISRVAVRFKPGLLYPRVK